MSEVALDEIAVRVSLSLFGAVEIGPDGVTKTKELLVKFTVVLRNSYFRILDPLKSQDS